jgi:hypothetical protein
MKKTGRITRRGLARLLGAAALARPGKTGPAQAAAQAREARTGRLQRAVEKLRRARPDRSISPAFRFIP